MKVLLYITTHLSAQHLSYLTACWNTTTRHPVLAAADTLVFAPHSKWKILKMIFPTAMYNSPRKKRQSYQLGAIDAMANNKSREIFKNYDWVVRLNPDVIIYSFDPIFKHMTDQVDALVGMCGEHYMTDFTVFRPKILPLQHYYGNETETEENAEYQMTKLLKNVDIGHIKILYKTPDYQCRFRWGDVVMHIHEEKPKC